MKKSLKVLNLVSKMIDLDLFFVCSVYKNKIRLQGDKSNLLEVKEVFEISDELDDNEWHNYSSVINGVNFHITLT